MHGNEADHEAQGPTRSLSNEFAYVKFTPVITGNGERLLLESPRRGRRILLDPVVLDALTCFTPEALSELVISLDTESSDS